MNESNITIKEWAEQKLELMKIFPILTDEDCTFLEGKKDDMLEGIQRIIGKTKEELSSIISKL
jgi:hypothetical protein